MGETASPAKQRATHALFQIRLSALFVYVILAAIFIRLSLWPTWNVPERVILIGWFVGWLVGLAYGRSKGKRGVLSATIGGTICGIGIAIVLYLGLSDDLNLSAPIPVQHRVVYPLVSLFALAVVASVLLAWAYHLSARIVQLSKRDPHSNSADTKRMWLSRTVIGLFVVSVFSGWIMSLKQWKPIARLAIGSGSATSFYQSDAPDHMVAFSKDNRLLALATNRGFIELWDLTSGKKMAHLDVDLHGGAHFARFSDSGEELTYGSSTDARVRIIDVYTRQLKKEITLDFRKNEIVLHPRIVWMTTDHDPLVVVSEPIFFDIHAYYQYRIAFHDWATGKEIRSYITQAPARVPAIHAATGVMANWQLYDPEEIKNNSTSAPRLVVIQLEDGKRMAVGPTMSDRAFFARTSFSRDGSWICLGNLIWNYRTGVWYNLPENGIGFLSDDRLLMIQQEGPRLSILSSIHANLSSRQIWWPYSVPFIRIPLESMVYSRLAIYNIVERRIEFVSSRFRGNAWAWGSSDGKLIATMAGNELQLWQVP